MGDRAEAAGDPARFRTQDDLARGLKYLYVESGLSLREIVKHGNHIRGQNRRVPLLSPSTLSKIFNGHTFPKRDVMELTLEVLGLSLDRRHEWVDAWRRLSHADAQDPTEVRLGQMPPWALGIALTRHPLTGEEVLPAYIERECDQAICRALTAGPNAGCFVIINGPAGCGKSRTLREAALTVAPDARIILRDELHLLPEITDVPATGVIVWLDDLHELLGRGLNLSAGVIYRVTQLGVMVVATMLAEEYNLRMTVSKAGEIDPYADDRKILRSASARIDLDPVMQGNDWKRAEEAAQSNLVIREAMVDDMGITQCLAGASDLIRRWQHCSDPFARAVMSAAADAERLGMGGWAQAELLMRGAVGYLPDSDRNHDANNWWPAAIEYAITRITGGSSVVMVNGAQPSGYKILQYVGRHGRRINRTRPVPAEMWQAIIELAEEPADLRRAAAAAINRMRYQLAIPLLKRLVDRGEPDAYLQLADLLTLQGRLAEATDLVRRGTATLHDQRLLIRLQQLVDLQRRIELVDDPVTAEVTIYEMLADGGRTEELRRRAYSGDAEASERLADLMVELGDLAGLNERAALGDRFAADRRAELLASQHRVSELGDLAAAGNEAASLRLVMRRPARGATEQLRTLAAAGNVFAANALAAPAVESAPESSEEPAPDLHENLQRLRERADEGHGANAEELAYRLFQLLDEDALRAEVEAGTKGASRWLIALLTAEGRVSRLEIARLRAFGVNADGSPSTHDRGDRS